MSREGRRGGGCLKLLIVFIVFLALLAGGVIYLVNQTPDSLGLADKVVYDGQTLRDMGFADVKIKDVFSLLKTIKNPDEAAIVKNAPDSAAEKTKADGAVKKSDIVLKSDGSPDYTTLISMPLRYDKHYLVSYDDTTLAYVFDSMVEQGVIGATDNAGLAYLKDISASVEEISITKSGAIAELRIVLSIETSSLTEQIDKFLGAAAGLLTIPEKVYIVSYSTLEADANGYIVTKSKSVKINDVDNALTSAIFKILANKATDAGVGVTDTNVVNDKIGSAFGSVVRNLGRVGYGAPDVDQSVSDVIYGSVGVVDGGLKIITHTDATVNADYDG